MSRRSLPVLVALALVAACGDDPDGSSAPPVLRIGTGAGRAEATGLAADSMMPGGKAMWMPTNWEFVVDGDLPALDSDAPAYVFPADVEPTAAQLAALSDAFGVGGTFTKTTTNAGTDYEWTTWSVGPTDGSGPSISVSDDGLSSWWYSEGWQTVSVDRPVPESGTSESGTSDSGSSDSGTIAPDSSTSGSGSGAVAPSLDEWVEPTPPENVPSAREAEAKFRELFARLGFGSDELIVESYSDDWSAGAWGYVVIGGVRTTLSMSASYGENGRLTYAGGYLARPQVLADYPRIGTTAGLERLRDDYGSFMGPVMARPAYDDTVVGVPEPDGEPETVTVRIVSVEEEYLLYWSVDGEVYLVPGYTFVAAEDEWGYRGRYSVPAIPSEYLDIVEPPVVTEPMPIEPEPAIPGQGDVIGIAPEDAERLVGLSEADATATATERGWDVRVVARDGEEFPITMDYSTSRVNLTVEKDVVVKVYVG